MNRMDALSDDERKDILGQVLMDELKAIREYVQVIPQMRQDIAVLKDDMVVVKAELVVIKATLSDLGYRVDDHEKRMKVLENTSV